MGRGGSSVPTLPYIIPWHELVSLLALLIFSKATLRPTRAPNKTPALAQELAVWSKPTLDLMDVTLTARKQRVYSKLVFKTYKKALASETVQAEPGVSL